MVSMNYLQGWMGKGFPVEELLAMLNQIPSKHHHRDRRRCGWHGRDCQAPVEACTALGNSDRANDLTARMEFTTSAYFFCAVT